MYFFVISFERMNSVSSFDVKAICESLLNFILSFYTFLIAKLYFLNLRALYFKWKYVSLIVFIHSVVIKFKHINMIIIE